MKTNYLYPLVMICICGLFFVPQAQAGMIQEHEITTKSDSAIKVKVGEHFSIRLLSDAEKGYLWVPETLDGITWLRHDYDPFAGSGAVEILWFVGEKAGTYELTLQNSNVFVATVVKATITYKVVVES